VSYITNLLIDKDGRSNGANYTLSSGATVGNDIMYDDLGRISSGFLYKKSGSTTTNLLNTSYSYTDLPQHMSTHQIFAINMRNNSGYSKR